MQTTPLVSIIMAYKDTAPYLEDCVRSILNQTYTNWELIAVNDHSTDESWEIVQRFADDKRIINVNSDGHRLIPTLKTGYKYARGSLINRMDSDDKMPDYKLEVLVSEWLKVGKGHVIAGGTQHFVDEGEVRGGFLKYENWLNKVAAEQRHYQEIYRECVIPSHSWIAHRDDFEKAGGFEPEVYPEDYDLCFRYYREGFKIIGIPHVLHYWRDRSNRISRTWDEYKDNRYFEMKTRYFFELDHDPGRPLVLWGAGRNGKDLCKLLKKYLEDIRWICENDRKIGHNIYGTVLESPGVLPGLQEPQILIAVTAEEEKEDIRNQLSQLGKLPVRDYWFFL